MVESYWKRAKKITTFAKKTWKLTPSEKDWFFIWEVLLKSGLSTLELAEIYCVSESAIFKRRQKIKNQLGFESDQRTLDAIFEEM